MRHLPGWQPWETYVNEQLGLDATVASGSQFYDKGDGVDRGQGEWAFQVDAKYTEAGSFSVGPTMAKWVTRAAMSGKRFALAVRVWGRGHHQPDDYVVLPFGVFKEMLDIVKTDACPHHDAVWNGSVCRACNEVVTHA